MSQENEENEEIIETNWDEKVSDFSSMNLKEDLMRGISAFGFENPSEIQQIAIKPTIMGRDIIAQAKSGTGKTGTFGISTLQLIDEEIKTPQALILAPVRELVEQITIVIKSLGRFMGTNGVNVESFVGGKSIRDDIVRLKNGAQIIVGTPGRIQDLITKNLLKLDDIKIFVLDEADEMLSDGFIEQVKQIFEQLNENVQVALFSATLSQPVKDLTTKFMKDPVRIYSRLNDQTLKGIPQYYIALEEEKIKIDVIADLYQKLILGNTIIFCSSIRTVDWLTTKLGEKDFSVSSMHSTMTQKEREEKIDELKKGNSRILITTDLLSRGIDIQQLSMVVNYDLPNKPETYIHRIGRCGRFGRKGIAINLICSKDIQKLKEIEDLYKTEINELPLNFGM